jgi:hypothetical protein
MASEQCIDRERTYEDAMPECSSIRNSIDERPFLVPLDLVNEIANVGVVQR